MIEEKGGIAFGVFSLAAICGVIFAVAKFQANHTASLALLQGQRIFQLENDIANMRSSMSSDDLRERADAATLAHLAAEARSEQSGISRLDLEVQSIRDWSRDRDLLDTERNTRQDTLLQLLLDERKKP
jgi:hypothetical protein